MNRLSLPFCADASAGPAKLDYQTELEKIIEKYIEAKLLKVQAIKTELLPKIESVSAGNNEHSMQIAKCMLQNMQEEIDRVTRENEEEKNREISLLKSQIM